MWKVSTILVGTMLCIGSQLGLAQSSSIAGQIVKVDSAAKKITIKHGPIPKLGMQEGMTMVFAAPEPRMLKAAKAGDRVNFDAERVNGQLTLTKIERAK